MNQCESADLIVLYGRTIVLVVSTIGGFFSIYLGWRLYKDVIVSRTEGNLKTKSWTFKLISAGPGVFFVAFGMGLLIFIASQQVKLSESTRRVNLDPRSAMKSDRHVASIGNAPNKATQSNAQNLYESGEVNGESVQQACLIYTNRDISFFDGPKTLTSAMATQALDAAIKSLELQDLSNQSQVGGPLSGINLREQIDVLKKLSFLASASTKN